MFRIYPANNRQDRYVQPNAIAADLNTRNRLRKFASGITALSLRWLRQIGICGVLGFAASANAQVPIQDIQQVAAGEFHSCARNSTGSVWCWGANNAGQIGDGTNTDRNIATRVSGLANATVIANGARHTCARTSTGAVTCWGANNLGQLGDGTNTGRLAPNTISGLTQAATVASEATAAHTCALNNFGTMTCWGLNASGQIGEGTSTNRNVPISPTGLSSGVAAIAVGSTHSCAVTTASAALCWGQNNLGQIGDNTTSNRFAPTAVIGLASGVAAMTAGNAHTCALTTAGAVQCWGFNNYGQLGNNSTTNSAVPVAVSGLSSGVVAIAAGEFHTCAITSAGAAQCWGRNDTSQLGSGVLSSMQTTPTPVSGLASGVISVAASLHQTCAATSSGGAKCWGSGGNGQLGIGANVQAATPTDVIGFFAPSAPAIGTATLGDTQATISFTAPTSDGGSPVTGYIATCGARSNTGTASPIVVSNLTNGVSVTCRVSATNSIGTSVLSSASNAVVPIGSQSITFAAQPAQTWTGASFPFNPYPTSSSGLVVTVSSATPSVCTTSGANIIVVTAGTCVINADQAGNAAFLPAAQVSQSITINKRDQTIVLTPPGTLFATLLPGQLSYFIPGSNLFIAVTSLTPTVCTVALNVTVWEVQGLIGGTCTVAANQAGNVNYNPAPQATLDITINKRTQSGLFGLFVSSLVFGGPSRTASVAGGSGTGAVTFSSNNGNCTITGNSVAPTGGGTCVITATKAADDVFNVASVSATFTVQQATQTTINIVFASFPRFGETATVSITGGGGTGAVTFSTSSSACTVSGTTITAVALGNCTITATKDADANYLSQTQTRALNIVQAPPTITAPAPADTPMGGGAVSFSVTTNSGGTALILSGTTGICTVSGSGASVNVNLVSVGTCTLNVTINATTNYTIGFVSRSFSITQGSQSITMGALPTALVGGTGTLSATGGASNLPIVFASTTPGICTVAGATVTGVSLGNCGITANQAGDANFAAAPQASASLTIGRGNQAITFGAAPSISNGQSGTISATGGASGNAIVFASSTPSACTVSGNTVTAGYTGSCTIKANQAGNTNYNAAPEATLSFFIVIGSWSSAASMSVPRVYHTMTKLANGNVLVAGGSPNANLDGVNTTEIYNAASGQWSAGANMSVARRQHTATLLSDGTVLVIGGANIAFNAVTASVERYNPATNTWSAAASLAVARRSHTATRLNDGRVLVIGGYDDNVGNIDNVAIYDPTTNVWASVGTTGGNFYDHTATLLANGKVLLVGGPGYATSRLYDPSTNVVSTVGSANNVFPQEPAAQLMPDGSVLLVGDNLNSVSGRTLSYDPSGNVWSVRANYLDLYSPAMTLLASGRVLVAGGYDPIITGNTFNAASAYDPGTNAWLPTGAMQTARWRARGLMLDNGKVLVAGGADYNGAAATETAEIYNPGTLPPDAPTIGIATASTASATVNFTGATGQGILSYSVLSSPGGVAGTCNAPCSSVTISGLSNGTPYTFTVTATNPNGTGLPSAASNVVTPIFIGQTITFGANPGPVAYSPSGIFAVSATGGASGNAVNFTSTTTSVCTTGGTNGSTVTIVSAGTCVVAANQAGNGTYAGAPQVTQSIAITAVAQSISFAAAPAMSVGDSGTVSATGGASGNPVIFSSTTPLVCTVSGTNGAAVAAVAAGSCVIAANQAGNASYNPAPQVTQSITINKANQAALTATSTLTTLNIGQTATLGTSGGNGTGLVSFSSNNANCTVAGTTLTAASAGSCTITATKAADTNYNPATSAGLTITVNQLAQIITFGTNPGPVNYSPSGTFTVSATGGVSGNAVTFTSNTTSVCTTGGTNGATVTIVTAGTCTIAANQLGNANYLAAPQVTQSITINKANQAPVTASSALTTLNVGQTATLGTSGGNGTGAVSFSSNNANCTIAGTTLTAAAAGSCTITANKAADTSYNQATSTGLAITVNAVPLTNQIITFGANPGPVTYAPSGSFTVSATGGASGNPVTFTSATTGICTTRGTNGGTVTVGTIGTCIIAANQAGNASHNPAPQVTQSITINKANQAAVTATSTLTTLNVGQTATLSTSGGNGTGAVSFSSNNANCTVAGTTLTAAAAGSCTITANKAADTNYNQATSTGLAITVNAVPLTNQIITFGANPGPVTIAPSGSFTVSATGGASGNPVTFTSATTGICTTSGTNGGTVTVVSIGTCIIAANQAGNASHNPAPQVTQSITINRPPTAQTVTFTPASPVVLGVMPITLTATASSGLTAFTFSTNSTANVCTVSGSTLTIVGPGTCALTATQAGNANVATASANATIVIESGAQTVTFAPASPVSFGAAPITLSATASSGLITFTFSTNSAATICTLSGNQLTIVGTGTCALTATQPGNGSFNSASASADIVINPVFIAVQSRKTHGEAGDFDIAIATALVAPDVTMEPRTIGSGHTIVFQFNAPVTAVGTVSVTPVGVATLTVVGNEVLVKLTDVADNQRVMVTLSNVNGAVTPPPANIGFLVGDINSTRSVNSSDISGVKARAGQVTDSTNFKFDLNASGGISSSDISAAKARSGLALP